MLTHTHTCMLCIPDINIIEEWIIHRSDHKCLCCPLFVNSYHQVIIFFNFGFFAGFDFRKKKAQSFFSPLYIINKISCTLTSSQISSFQSKPPNSSHALYISVYIIAFPDPPYVLALYMFIWPETSNITLLNLGRQCMKAARKTTTSLQIDTRTQNEYLYSGTSSHVNECYS